jgi:hypothetical protein
MFMGIAALFRFRSRKLGRNWNGVVGFWVMTKTRTVKGLQGDLRRLLARRVVLVAALERQAGGGRRVPGGHERRREISRAIITLKRHIKVAKHEAQRPDLDRTPFEDRTP